MLSEEALERLSEKLVNRIEKLNLFMIQKIGDQIVNIGTLTPTQLMEIFQSVKYGNDIDEIVSKIAEITNLNINDIYSIMEEVAIKNQEFARQFYEYRNIKFIPYEKNLMLQKHVNAIAKATANEYMNISNTMAFVQYNEQGKREFIPIAEMYQRITDNAILSVSQGKESYQVAMRKAIKELSSNGIRTVDYASGYSRRMDSSVRMNVMDGIRRVNRELQEEFGKDFGADGVEISHHENAAPDHIDTIDGKQFSKEEYERVNNSLDRHVGELNCNHFVFQIVLGVSEPMYSKEKLELDKKKNKEGFEFEGIHYTNYEGTQLQRKLETEIRKYKDRQIAAKAINDEDEIYYCQEKIRQLNQKYDELSKVSGLPTKVDRLRVEGFSRVRLNKNDNPKTYHVDNETLQNAIFSDKISTNKWIVPKNTIIENVTVIAGQGTSTDIRAKRKLEQKYSSGNWTKRSGTVNGKYYSYQIHYYEKDGIQYEGKLKDEPKERK